jgi:FkbM family methyltransferase
MVPDAFGAWSAVAAGKSIISTGLRVGLHSWPLVSAIPIGLWRQYEAAVSARDNLDHALCRIQKTNERMGPAHSHLYRIPGNGPSLRSLPVKAANSPCPFIRIKAQIRLIARGCGANCDFMGWKNLVLQAARPFALAVLAKEPLPRAPYERVSYSASGEDRIVLAWLERVFKIDISKARYCDMGANHPIDLNNTFLLYSVGARGVLVEPNPDLRGILCDKRPNDVVLSVGVAFDERRLAKLKRMTSHVFNTFSSDSAEFIAKDSNSWHPDQKQDLIDEIEVPLVPANEILAEHFSEGIDFLSIDAEGVDGKILHSIDFKAFRPKIICIEGTADFDRVLQPFGYEVIAKTPDNFLYCLV